MGLPSRRKGASGEREVRDILRRFGIEARRDGRLDDDLVHGLDGFHIEVKRREQYDLGPWLEQAEEDAKGREPIVVFRKSKQPWRAVIRLEALLQILTNHEEETDAEEAVPGASGAGERPNEVVAGRTRCR